MAKRSKGKRHKRVNHAGVTGGIIGTGIMIMMTSGSGASSGNRTAVEWLMDRSQTISNRVEYAAESAYHNLMEPSTYAPVIGGALLTASPRIPLVRTIAAPVNSAFKSWSRGRWGL